MDEDLLFKTHNESKIPEINLNCQKTQKQTTFSQKFENGFLKEESSLFRKTLKNRQEKSIAKVLQNYDYKTNILSNITLDKDISSPFLSNIIYYSFSSDCLFKIRRSNRCAIRNHKNENIFFTNKKMLILNDKYYSGFNSIMKNNLSDKIINRTLCDFKESCLTSRQSNLKRKLESDVINELNLRLDNKNKNSSKLITYTEMFDRTLSYSKHFKSDNSSQISENRNEHFVFQPNFMNRIDTIENCNFKQMKNIEIQSSPVKIRVAANFGEDSVEYIDPTMEVELDSDDSDPDEPGEQNVGAAENPQQQNQTADTNNGENSEDEENISSLNMTNIVEEDNSNKSQSEHPVASNEDAYISTSILNEQCLDKDTHNNIETKQSESDIVEDDYEENVLEKKEEIDTENSKDSAETFCVSSLPKDMLTPDIEEKTDISLLNRSENDPITLDKISDEVNNGKLTSETVKHEVSISGANQAEFYMNECSDPQHEELVIDSAEYKTIEVNEMKKQTEISENIDATKISKGENVEEEAEKSESEKEKDDGEKAKNQENEEQEKLSKIVDCMEVNGDDGTTEESNEKGNDTCIEQSENISEKEEEFLEDVVDEKMSKLIDEQESELQEDYNNKEAEENITEDKIQIDDAGAEQMNADTETPENLEDNLRNKHNEVFEGNETEEIECIKKIDGNISDYEKENTEDNVIYKVEENEKETAVDSEKSESITDEISENKDEEVTEIKLDTANGGIPLKQVESCNEEKELEHEEEELNEIVKEEKEENLQSHHETEDEQLENLKINYDEDTFLDEQKSLDNLSHPIVENAEDSIEKDSIENRDNCLNTRKQETKAQYLSPNLEKYDLDEGTPEVSADEMKDVKEEPFLATENTNIEEIDKVENNSVQQLIPVENTTRSGDVSEKSEENNSDKEELSPEGNEFPSTISKTVGIEEYMTENNSNKSVNDSNRAYVTDLALEKVDETAIHVASENDSFNSESADENISDSKKHATIKEERVGDMKEKLSDEEQYESNEKVEGKKEEEITQKSKEGENNVRKPSLTGIVEDTAGQVMVLNANEKETFISCQSTTQESTPKEDEGTVCQTNADQAMVRSPEKQKVEKPEQYSSDSAKVISPRKGIKVEEDEIETAISSIVFYDEMSDGSEHITQTVPSAMISKPSDENEIFSCENILTSGDAQKTIEEEASEMPPSNVNEEEQPLHAATEPGDLASAETKVQPSTSPKKRKKKRKISRSRSAQKDGTSSATKRSQDSKGSARTTRSVSSTSARSPSVGEKKLPPIKAPVGTTPPPNIKQVRSKIGSLDNVTHKPKGGDKKVETVKLEWNAKSKIGSLEHANYKPGGGDKKILTQKLQFKNVQSKVGSKDNLKHKPAGGNVKISTEKLDFKAKAASKVGSLDNAKHKPGGGNVTIKSEKLHFKERATPKIQSRSGSERGSSHGGSETQSPIMPSSPAPPEELPPLNEDENPSSQEEVKPENPQESNPQKVECNGAGESTQEQQPPSNDASQTQSEVTNTANDANNDNNANDGEDAKEDQLIAF